MAKALVVEQMVVNLKVKVDGSTVDYNNIPANNNSVSYNNGNLIIAESKRRF